MNCGVKNYMKDDHGSITRQFKDLLLALLVERCMHRCSRGQGFESRTNLNFFSGFLSQLQKMIILHIILHSAVHMK